jgi:hypothetical protein
MAAPTTCMDLVQRLLPGFPHLPRSLRAVALSIAAGVALLAPPPALAQQAQIGIVTPTPEGSTARATPTTPPTAGRGTKQSSKSATPKVVTPTPAVPTPTSIPTATPIPTMAPVSAVATEVSLPNGVSVAEAYARALGQAPDQRTPATSRTDPPIPTNLAMVTPTAEPATQDDGTEQRARPNMPVVADWAPTHRTADGLSAHVLTYAGLILGAAEEIGVDPALIAALMEVEGSGPNAVSHAGAMGLMQLMPDKLQAGDDPFDSGTNILRAAQLLRRLTAAYRGDLIAVSAAYFGAIDHQGQVTDSSDGISTGFEYVSRFAAAYQRWALAFNQPHQVLAIRPAIQQRSAASESSVDKLNVASFEFSSPERDRWYLFMERAQPALPPTVS